MTPGTALSRGWGMCEKALPPKEMDMTKSHVHFFCQVATIRIFLLFPFAFFNLQASKIEKPELTI